MHVFMCVSEGIPGVSADPQARLELLQLKYSVPVAGDREESRGYVSVVHVGVLEEETLRIGMVLLLA